MAALPLPHLWLHLLTLHGFRTLQVPPATAGDSSAERTTVRRRTMGKRRAGKGTRVGREVRVRGIRGGRGRHGEKAKERGE